MIVLSKLTLEEILELGAEHFSMISPTDSIYNVGPAADFLKRRISEKISDGKVVEAKRLSSELDAIVEEVIQNAIEHGNQLKPDKQIHAYLLWQEHKSGNALLYIIVRDDGDGFDVDAPLTKNPHFGNEGLIWTKSTMDLVYNFKDSAVYMVKVIRRENASPETMVKVTEHLTRKRLGKDQYHGYFTYTPDSFGNHSAELATAYAFDLHALVETGDFDGSAVVPKNDAVVDIDPWSTSDSPLVIKPYFTVGVMAESIASFLERARIGGLKIPYAGRGSRHHVAIHTNSLFHSVGPQERVDLSYGLSLIFSKMEGQLVQLYRKLPKDG